VKELKEKYNVYFFIPTGTAHGRDPALRRYWEKLLGAENVGILEDASDPCTAIAKVMAGAAPKPVSTPATVRL